MPAIASDGMVEFLGRTTRRLVGGMIPLPWEKLVISIVMLLDLHMQNSRQHPKDKDGTTERRR